MGKGYEFSEGGMPREFEFGQNSDVTGVIEMGARPVPPAVISPNFGHVVPAAAIIERVMKDMSMRSSFIDSLNQQQGDK